MSVGPGGTERRPTAPEIGRDGLADLQPAAEPWRRAEGRGGVTVLMTLGLPDGTGAHRMAIQFARAFRRRGHRVVLAMGSGRKAASDPLLLGDPDSGAPDGISVVRLSGFQRTFDASLLSELPRLLTREGADCVVAFQQSDRKYALLAARRAGLPCVIHAGNQHTFWGPWPLPLLKGWAYGFLLRRHADLVVCTSETVEREVVGRFGVRPDRTRVQPNGIDVRGFPRPGPERARTVRVELGLDPEDVVLAHVGRIDVQKGQDLLLKAFAPIAASHPRARLVLVGSVPDSSNRGRMERYARELSDAVESEEIADRVTFTGWRDDVPSLLAAADLYVHPSRWEGPALCLSVLEAMAAGLPVISTDCSGHPEGFEDGTHGHIVPTGEIEPLRTTVARLLALTDEERRAMGRRARELALERYDGRVLAARFVRRVERLVSDAAA